MRYYYQGDVSLENGGYFANASNWERYDYADVVRVTPCSDAGCQDNAWWIEALTVTKPPATRLYLVLQTCGWHINAEGDIANDHNAEIVARKGTAAFRRAMIDACIGYGLYDHGMREVVQIGPRDEFHRGDTIEADNILRSNASLRRFVQKNYLR